MAIIPQAHNTTKKAGETKQKIKEILNGKRDISTIPSGMEYVMIQHVMEKMGRIDVYKKMAELSEQRLKDKGYIYYPQAGWHTPLEAGQMGLVEKYGKWRFNRERVLEFFNSMHEQRIQDQEAREIPT